MPVPQPRMVRGPVSGVDSGEEVGKYVLRGVWKLGKMENAYIVAPSAFFH